MAVRVDRLGSSQQFPTFLVLASPIAINVMGSIDKTLVITDTHNLNLDLSARNVKNVKVLKTEGLNIFDIMKYQRVIFTEKSVRAVEGVLQS